MNAIEDLLQQKKVQLFENLEEQVRLCYQLRTSLRAATWEQPQSLEQVLQTWVQIHHQHHQLQKIIKVIQYEKSLRIKSGRTKEIEHNPGSAGKKQGSQRRTGG